MSNGEDIRSQTLQNRDLLSPSQLQQKSEIISQRLHQEIISQNFSTIFIYVNFRSEVITIPTIDLLISEGRQVCVPLTRVTEKRLDIIEIRDHQSELQPGYCNIPEPLESLVAERLINPESLDLIVLPGSVFDQRGGRYGYGGGYYDRLLSTIPQTTRIALAFDLQIVPELKLKTHDEIMDLIITEKSTIEAPGRAL